MSQSPSDASNGSSDRSSGGSDDATTGESSVGETGAITDEMLPEDLQPEKNPLARTPDDDSEDSTGGPGGPDAQVDGMPDMGQPGA
jgi:hypothetical protein